MQSSPSLTEVLANLSVWQIMLAASAATVVRLAMIRWSSPNSRWVVELLESGIIAVVLVYLLIRPFAVQAYFIPSPSMEPTLLGNNGVGDRILVNKMVYRVSRPKHGDVVVFIPPRSATEGTGEEQPGIPVNYIKRLIGLPGDVLVVHAGKVLVNGTAYSHGRVREELQGHGMLGGPAMALEESLAEHHVKFVTDGVLIDGKTLIDKPHLAEMLGNPGAQVTVQPGYTMRNGVRVPDSYTAEDPDYDMRLFHGQPLRADYSSGGLYKLNDEDLVKAQYDIDCQTPPGKVPPGMYFMMGDNRNDSKDSTFWGPLAANRVIGKAEYIFWPMGRVRAIH